MEGSMALSKWHAYSRLMRIDRPIGSLLLLWPTYWALWIAAQGSPSLHILIVFTAGVFLMRAAGCVINDFADRNFDGHVERTKHRPLPSGDVTEKEAKILFAALVGLSFLLVLSLNTMTIWLSVAGLALAWIYPFVKRVSHLPQVVLGAAFGWSIPMGFSAVSESLPLVCWLLFLVNIIWSVIYDTQYAMVDRNDDLKIGVKSTAILFGQYDKLIIGLLQIVMVGLLVVIGSLANLGMVYYGSLVLAAALFVYQQQLMINRERAPCFKAFMNNNYVGLILFFGMVVSYF
ncbi:4-hydroxybenzoate polyprenyl transferase [Providencia alcalifaciens 205/92]|uniref:4-hydroxybenzoate octaprenyltransferase n=2 Tax=Providencia alcalifaciens TaxID=126385 RepID=A0AAV3M3A0_9GAMM|nr:4-hydroxybenzoate polyprenyl transferase [Providencia alcalifaciens 205/92]